MKLVRTVPQAAYYACYQLLAKISNELPPEVRETYMAEIKQETKKKKPKKKKVLGSHEWTIEIVLKHLKFLKVKELNITEAEEKIYYLKNQRIKSDYKLSSIAPEECKKIYTFAVWVCDFLEQK